MCVLGISGALFMSMTLQVTHSHFYRHYISRHTYWMANQFFHTLFNPQFKTLHTHFFSNSYLFFVLILALDGFNSKACLEVEKTNFSSCQQYKDSGLLKPKKCWIWLTHFEKRTMCNLIGFNEQMDLLPDSLTLSDCIENEKTKNNNGNVFPS